MVLTNVFSRRPSNTENIHPSSRLNPKQPSNFRSSIQNASKRRRARTSGGPRNPRYVTEQAKKRSMTKSSSSATAVSLQVTAEEGDTEMKDTEMADVEASGSGSTSVQKTSTPITLPRCLARPDYKEISKEVITAVDPELSSIPVQYIREGLEVTGPDMMQVLSSVEATPVKNSLPKELSIIVNDLSSDLPTHMLAVYSRQSSMSPNPTRRVTLFPTHNIVMASHCAHLPMLPKSIIPTPDNIGQMTLPVVPLCIPAPDTFSQLSAYLYLKNANQLLASLLPTGQSTPSTLLSHSLDDEDEAGSVELQHFSAKLRATYTPHALLAHAMTVNGLWRNVVALGVFDDQLWDVLDLAWGVILAALEGKSASA